MFIPAVIIMQRALMEHASRTVFVRYYLLDTVGGRALKGDLFTLGDDEGSPSAVRFGVMLTINVKKGESAVSVTTSVDTAHGNGVKDFCEKIFEEWYTQRALDTSHFLGFDGRNRGRETPPHHPIWQLLTGTLLAKVHAWKTEEEKTNTRSDIAGVLTRRFSAFVAKTHEQFMQMA